MKRKLVFKYLFRSFWFSPWATELPNADVCTSSPFQLLPFPGGTMVFLSRHLVERMGEAKLWLVTAEAASEVWDEWQTGWWEGLGGGPCRPAPGDFEVWKARGRQPGKTQIHSPSNWLFSCISETHSLVGLTAIVSFCCLWGRGGGSEGNSGQRWGLRGLEVRSHPAHKACCLGICKPPFFFFFNPVWDGQWCKVDPDKKEKMQPLMNGWRRRKNECRHYGQMEFLWANDFSILCGVDDMNTP